MSLSVSHLWGKSRGLKRKNQNVFISPSLSLYFVLSVIFPRSDYFSLSLSLSIPLSLSLSFSLSLSLSYLMSLVLIILLSLSLADIK